MGSRGPQPLADEVKRRHRIGFYVSDLELQQLQEATGIAGLVDLVAGGGEQRKGSKEVQAELRHALLNARPRITVPSVNRDAFVQLTRVGSNVNQIAAALNAGAMNARDRAVIRAILEELELAKLAVVGAVQPAAAPPSPGALDLPPQF